MEPHKQLRIQRVPFPDGFQPGDPAVVRQGLVDAMEREISIHGRLAPAMTVFLTDAQLIVDTGGLFDVGDHELAAATLRGLAEWRGAVRAYREGEIVVEIDGQLRRAAALLEVGPQPTDGEEKWWATWRPIGTGDGGVGVLHGEWSSAEGVGLESMPEPLREWLDSGDKAVRLGGMKFESTPPPPPDVRMLPGRFQKPLPSTADELAMAIGAGFDKEALEKGLDCILILTFKQLEWERWEIRGEVQCSIDDLIRAITQSSQPEAVAYITGTTGPFHGAQRRGVSTLAEVGGRRYERVLPLTFGHDGRPSGMPFMGRWHGGPDGTVPPRIDGSARRRRPRSTSSGPPAAASRARADPTPAPRRGRGPRRQARGRRCAPRARPGPARTPR